MTINKSHGQTLQKVGVNLPEPVFNLPEPVFNHTQLYVCGSVPSETLFRCNQDQDQNCIEAKLIPDSDAIFTKNVVFTCIFLNYNLENITHTGK